VAVAGKSNDGGNEMNRPTAAQKRYFGRIFDAGCVACNIDCVFSFPEIHHIRKYGKRDHSRVIGLCPAHHRHGVNGVPSVHGNPMKFREFYGTDEELIARQKEMLGDK
jgi:hypothetical protein